jgi:O-succinylbenzoate synthase
MSKYRGNNMAKASIDYAFWYLLSKSLQFPLLSITTQAKKKFKVQESIPITTNEQISKWIEEAYSRSIKSIKIKIEPGHSWEAAKFVKETYAPNFISVDANGSFNPHNEKHVKELYETSDYVDEIEQPFRPKNLSAHAEFSKEITPVVSLDESIENTDDALEYCELSEAKGVINIKPPRLGGLYNSWELAVEMNKKKVDCFVGGLLETSLGRGFNMAVATMKGVCDKYTADFSPPSDFYKDDIVYKSFELKEGFVEVPESKDVPFEVDREKLEKYGKMIVSIHSNAGQFFKRG